MGFNKRFLTIENIKKVYEEKGVKGVEEYIKPDGLYLKTEKELKVLTVMRDYRCDTMRKIKLEETLYESINRTS